MVSGGKAEVAPCKLLSAGVTLNPISSEIMLRKNDNFYWYLKIFIVEKPINVASY